MIPPELVDRHRATQQSLVTLANRDLLAVWRTLDLDDARAATGVLLPVMRDLTGAYGDQSAVLAADFYDDSRAAVGPPGRFRAAPATVAVASQVDATTRWAVTPLWSTDPRYGDALKRLSAGGGKLIRQAAAETVVDSSERDTSSRGWQRVTAPGACKFCTMLSDRGAVFRGDTVRFAAHNNCMCSAVPSWDPDATPASAVQYRASLRTRSAQDSASLRRYLNTHYPDLPG